jgi:hypothetical protein
MKTTEQGFARSEEDRRRKEEGEWCEREWGAGKVLES